MKIRIKKTSLYSFIVIGIVAILMINIFPTMFPIHNTSNEREDFISLKNHIQEDMRSELKYKCCLEKACTYCIEKGDDAECDCLEDVMNGRHPCGECIGEILEGHGNPYIAEYFATAISEKTGQKEAIQLIIEEKYGIPVKDQI